MPFADEVFATESPVKGLVTLIFDFQGHLQSSVMMNFQIYDLIAWRSNYGMVAVKLEPRPGVTHQSRSIAKNSICRRSLTVDCSLRIYSSFVRHI